MLGTVVPTLGSPWAAKRVLKVSSGWQTTVAEQAARPPHMKWTPDVRLSYAVISWTTLVRNSKLANWKSTTAHVSPSHKTCVSFPLPRSPSTDLDSAVADGKELRGDVAFPKSGEALLWKYTPGGLMHSPVLPFWMTCRHRLNLELWGKSELSCCRIWSHIKWQ